MQVRDAATPIALTGAAGGIGTVLRPALLAAGYRLRSHDLRPLSPLDARETVEAGDLRDAAVVDRLLAGVRTLVHMAGTSVERPLDEIIENNLRGLVSVYEGARRYAVGRIVFASSNHAFGMHETTETLSLDAPFRPDGFYGLSKAWGESLAQLYWHKHGIETVSLRIGTAAPRPTERRHLSTWLGHRDLVSLVVRAIEAERVGCIAVWGVSNNRRRWWTNDAGAAALAYRPEQDAEVYAATIEAIPPTADRIAARYQGGSFASHDYTRWPEDTDPSAD